MILEITHEEAQRTTVWPGRIGLVLESPELVDEIYGAIGEIKGDCAFRLGAGAPVFEVAHLVERERADLVLVELSKVKGGAGEWINSVRAGGDMPLVIAVNRTPDPPVMIEAMRAGANEFLSLPARPTIFEALDRLLALMESRKAAAQVRGKMAGILSAKGGCGATTVACHLGAALAARKGAGKVLVADLDPQSSYAHQLLKVAPQRRVGDAFDNVRRMNAASWTEFTTQAGENLDLLAGWESSGTAEPPLSEPWRIESMFRFLSRNYGWVLADLGRNLNPASWAFIQNLDDLYIVTAPDVLALFQTRSILQTLTGRGFDKTRLHLILNRNQKGPQDFWIESIQNMFEMSVIAVLPDDRPTMERPQRDRFEFPAGSPFGRSVMKFADVLVKSAEKDSGKKA
jgi:pilus assembly protein CpaE